jgi:Na+/proline symporter
MKILDWLVLCIYFLVMIGMGFWARTKIKTAGDFFTAGGAMPWWLSGISHHMSGYSSAAFVAYAATCPLSRYLAQVNLRHVKRPRCALYGQLD